MQCERIENGCGGWRRSRGESSVFGRWRAELGDLLERRILVGLGAAPVFISNDAINLPRLFIIGQPHALFRSIRRVALDGIVVSLPLLVAVLVVADVMARILAVYEGRLALLVAVGPVLHP